jgi:hypothetical protein
MTVAGIYFEEDQIFSVDYYNQWWITYVNDMFYALRTLSPEFIIINTIGGSLIIYRVLMIIDGERRQTSKLSFNFMRIIQTIVITSLVYLAIFLGGWGMFFLLFVFFILLLYASVQFSEKMNLFSAFGRTWNLAGANFGQVMGLQFTLMLMSFSFLLVLSAPLLYMYTSIIQWNFADSDVWSQRVVHFIEIFVKNLAFNLIIPILVASACYLHFSLVEVLSAHQLKNSIGTIGTKLSKYGRR